MADKGKEVLPHTGSDNVQSSSSSVHTTAVEKDNPQQPLWSYVKKIGKGPGGGGNVMFACNFCEMRFTVQDHPSIEMLIQRTLMYNLKENMICMLLTWTLQNLLLLLIFMMRLRRLKKADALGMIS
ncbi:hypothetical protein EJ110_NYTH41561 [Nymphaea thermarum]|nr:hypothetical protein EJ110_NYTH41561 [Nymphaea thermarum]